MSTVETGFAQSKLYAAAQQALKPPVEDSDPDNPVKNKKKSEQLSSLTWEKVEGKAVDLGGNDAVYLTGISPALAENAVDPVASKNRLNFKEKAVKVLEDKLGKLVMDTYSHNFFVAELSKMGVGVISFQLSMLGVEPSEISALMGEAKQQKTAAVKTGVEQLVSEKVLFGVVTGARIA